MTVKRKLEQTFETTQADEKDDEHSEEYINIFSQGDEKQEAVALELIAEGEDEEDDENPKEWLDIFSHETEQNATEKVAEVEEEEADNIFFTDLWDQFEALEERVKLQGMHIQ
jgi:hypothetical protein